MPQISLFIGVRHISDVAVLRFGCPQADPRDLMPEHEAEKGVTELVDRRTDEPRNKLDAIRAPLAAFEKKPLRHRDHSSDQNDQSDRDRELKGVLLDHL